MDEATLRLFIEERLRAYDSKVNLDTGAPATIEVVDPIVRRFLPDPLEPDLKKFALTRLRQEFPRLMAEEGAAVADLLIKPGQVLLEPMRREVRGVKRQLSLSNPSTLISDEADSLMHNVFVRRKTGDFARVKVRAYFTNPLSVQIGSTNFAFTGRNLRFIPTEPQTLTAEGMLLNSDGNLFYFDINYIAEAPGVRYNIGSSEIAGITGLQAATRSTNLTRAEYGINEETTIQMISRGEQSIGERSLTTVPGTVAVLFEEFSGLQILQVIGFNDPEMRRDIITGGNRGPILFYGEDGVSSDDGSTGAFTGWFDSASGDFEIRLGPVGTDLSGYEITVFSGGAPSTPTEYLLGEVLGATRVSINESYEDGDRLPFPSGGSLTWLIRKRETLTLSGIPGGILFPDELATEIEINDNEIHVGGCADIMVKGDTIEDKALAVSVIADQNAIARREDARFTNGVRVVQLVDITVEEFDDITAQRSALYVETGPNEGAYKILAKDISVGPSYLIYIQIVDPSTLTTTSPGHSYVVVDDIDIDLTGPKEVKYEGSDLRTYAGIPLVDTVSGLPDFLPVSGVGVVDGDIVEIINGDDRGQYGVATGGVSAAQLTLEANMTQTDGPLQYRIYRLGTGLELPLLRIKSVEMLDSDLKPRGAFISYRKPVDVQSNSFQNPGRGAKAGTTVDPDDRLTRSASPNEDIVESSEVVNFYDVGVRVGDLVNVITTGNRGFYTVLDVGGSPTTTLNNDQLQLDRDLTWPSSDMKYDLGPPSYGSFRLYFPDPVTFEVSYSDTFFSIELGNGSSIRYRPDQDVNHEFLPTLTTVSTAQMTAAQQSMWLWPPGAGAGTEIQHAVHDIKAGDRLTVTYAPIVGAIDLSSASIDLDGKSFIVDVGSGYETVTFSGTTLNLSSIVSQINSQLSKEVALKYTRTAAPVGEYLMLRGDHEITIDGTGTATAQIMDDGGISPNSRARFMPWFPTGDFDGNTTGNDSPDEGTYIVAFPDTVINQIALENLNGSVFSASYTVEDELGHYVHLSHVSIQRISSTEMAEQQDDLGLYYFDVECISEGYGDSYNIGEDQQATVEGYFSEGWDISVEDENLSYSMAEVPWLSVSPRILVEGVDDDPNNYTELTGTSIQVNYERMPLVSYVHSYVMEKRNRIVCESPLARALFPTYIRTYLNYRGGGSVDDVRADLVELIEQTIPEQDLEASDIHHVVRRLGSSYVRQPLIVVGIAHQSDRSIWVSRSEDAIRTGRLSAMIPDDDGTTVEGASYLILDREIS